MSWSRGVLFAALAIALGACGARSVSGDSHGDNNGGGTKSGASGALDTGGSSAFDSGAPRADTAPAARPDLHFAKTTIALNSDERRVRYDMTVCNRGSAVASPARVMIYNDLAEAPRAEDKPNIELRLSTLFPAKCEDLAIAQGPLDLGTYRSWALIAPLGLVGESDLANNVVAFDVFSFTR